MPVYFQDSTGGHAYSDVLWYNVLRIIEDSIQEIYGVDSFFEKQKIDTQPERVNLLKRAYCLVHEKWKLDPTILEERPQTDIFDLIDNVGAFSLEEFERQLLPLIEAAFVWRLNKELGQATAKFRHDIATRIREGDVGNFYGYLFEIYISGLYVYDGWKPIRPNVSAEGGLDWIFQRGSRTIGIECVDKRISLQLKKNPTYSDINDAINHARPKFTSWAGKLDRKLVFVNITKPDYLQPIIKDLGDINWESRSIGRFEDIFGLGHRIDGIVLYWRQKAELESSASYDQGFAYYTKFAIAGSVDKKADLPRVWPLFEMRPKRWFRIRKDLESPPTVGTAGQVETAHDYYNKRISTQNRLVSEKPDDPLLWVDLGDIFAELANHLWQSGDQEQGAFAFREACCRYKCAAIISVNPATYYKWAVSLHGLARILGGKSEWQAAESACRESIEKCRMATQLAPGMFEAYHGWAVASFYLAFVLAHKNEPVPALRSLEEACERYKDASNIEANKGAVYYDWGNTLGNMAFLLRKMGDPEKSIRTLGEACAKYCKSTQIIKDFRVYNSWGLMLNLLATILHGQGRVSQSWQVLRKACSKYDKAAEIAPGEAQIFKNWRNALANLATLLYARGESTEDWLVLIEELNKLIHREKWLG